MGIFPLFFIDISDNISRKFLTNILRIFDTNFGRLQSKPLNVANLSVNELNAELEKGYADMASGKTKPARQAFEDIRKDYGI